MFISNLTYRLQEVESWKSCTPLAHWKGIRSHDGVITLMWRHEPGNGSPGVPTLTGVPRWDALPPNVVYIALSKHQLQGELPCELLPQSLRSLDVSHNRFYGALSLSMLPSNMVNLEAPHNFFGGSIQLFGLPSSLSRLALHHNKFTGMVNLLHAPPRLKVLTLFGNNVFIFPEEHNIKFLYADLERSEVVSPGGLVVLSVMLLCVLIHAIM